MAFPRSYRVPSSTSIRGFAAVGLFGAATHGSVTAAWGCRTSVSAPSAYIVGASGSPVIPARRSAIGGHSQVKAFAFDTAVGGVNERGVIAILHASFTVVFSSSITVGVAVAWCSGCGRSYALRRVELVNSGGRVFRERRADG